MNNVVRYLRLFFGLFMVVVYLGMAYLLIMNYFGWEDTLQWNIIRWGMAAILGCYGLYRCYRQIAGIDYYRNADMENRSSSWKRNEEEKEET